MDTVNSRIFMIFNAMTQWWENCDNIPIMILDIITLFVVKYVAGKRNISSKQFNLSF